MANDIDELKRNLRRAKRRWKVVTAALVKRRKERDEAIERLHQLHDRFADIVLERKELKSKPVTPQIKERLRELHEQQLALQARAESLDTERDRAIARAHELLERQKWFFKRKTTLRKKLKEAKANQQNGQPKYESWMANGYNDNVTQGVKNFIARGVVNYDLVTTSLKRTYVPPGGSTTSYHLQTPGKAGDIAGSRMQEFQVNEYNRWLGNSSCLELFGPSNSHNLKYGGSLTLGEGTLLENLHDTHVHGAF